MSRCAAHAVGRCCLARRSSPYRGDREWTRRGAWLRNRSPPQPSNLTREEKAWYRVNWDGKLIAIGCRGHVQANGRFRPAPARVGQRILAMDVPAGVVIARSPRRRRTTAWAREREAAASRPGSLPAAHLFGPGSPAARGRMAPAPRGGRPRPGAVSGEGRGTTPRAARGKGRNALVCMVSPVGTRTHDPKIRGSRSASGSWRELTLFRTTSGTLGPKPALPPPVLTHDHPSSPSMPPGEERGTGRSARSRTCDERARSAPSLTLRRSSPVPYLPRPVQDQRGEEKSRRRMKNGTANFQLGDFTICQLANEFGRGRRHVVDKTAEMTNGRTCRNS